MTQIIDRGKNRQKDYREKLSLKPFGFKLFSRFFISTTANAVIYRKVIVDSHLCSLCTSDVDYLLSRQVPQPTCSRYMSVGGKPTRIIQIRLVKVVSIIINNIMPQQLFSYSIPEVYKRDIDQADF